MTTATIARQLAAIVATVLVSAACLLGAVGPAAVNGSAPVVLAIRA